MARKKDKLIVIWSSGDRDVALKTAFMYTLNSKLHDWWKDVTLVVWGPSAELITKDNELQEYLEKMKEAGVDLGGRRIIKKKKSGLDKLRKMGIEVKKMSSVLTDYLKQGCTVITF